MKYIKKSDKYKNVYLYKNSLSKDCWVGKIEINSKKQTKTKKDWTERDCAKWVDIQLIRANKEPLNILIKQ